MTKPALSQADLVAVDELLRDDDAERLALYPGAAITRQPVHTVYVPADRVHARVCGDWGAEALAVLDRHAADPAAFAAATGFDAADVASVWDLVRRKLADEPVEDLRIDLEDGYGARSDDEEDEHAVRAGRAVAEAAGQAWLSPYSGIRFKSLEASTRARGIRSLDLVLGAILEHGPLPDGWTQTLPKVTSVRQVSAMVELCSRLEERHGLEAGTLTFEIQVETPQSILGSDGRARIAQMVHAAHGRCTGLHFGTYDYTAAVGIAGGYQSMDHPAADHAKQVMQLAAAGTPVRVSDGSTNVLPVGEAPAVHAAWALHSRLVWRSLERGFYQGWDLHPAQLPTRYLATYVFFRRDLAQLADRLGRYLRGGTGGVLDEPATAQAMAGFLLRGVHCGAVTTTEVGELAGCDLDALTALAGRRVG